MVISSLRGGASGGVLEISHGPVRRCCESRESDRVERQGEINEPIFFLHPNLLICFSKSVSSDLGRINIKEWSSKGGL